ncbi:unnamed protein product [Phaeothamnion confervicola]
MSAPQPGQVRASHILIKHSHSRRLASLRDPTGAQIKNRSREEAIRTLQSLREQISSAEDFANVAQNYSDCGSSPSGGDLGFFGQGTMMPPFEQAAFALHIGDLSDIIETDSGVHIILRTG